LTALRAVPVMILAIVATSCSNRDADVAAVSRIGPERLVADANSLRSKASGSSSVAQTLWPASIRELGPMNVHTNQEGVFVQLRTRFVEEEGVFLAFDGAIIQTGPHHDPSFRLIDKQVYWYKIKG
jgi:hypothetical protein